MPNGSCCNSGFPAAFGSGVGIVWALVPASHDEHAALVHRRSSRSARCTCTTALRNSREHAFKQPLEEIAASHPALRLNVVYSRPGESDVLGRDYQHAGHVDVELLAAHAAARTPPVLRLRSAGDDADPRAGAGRVGCAARRHPLRGLRPGVRQAAWRRRCRGARRAAAVEVQIPALRPHADLGRTGRLRCSTLPSGTASRSSPAAARAAAAAARRACCRARCSYDTCAGPRRRAGPLPALRRPAVVCRWCWRPDARAGPPAPPRGAAVRAALRRAGRRRTADRCGLLHLLRRCVDRPLAGHSRRAADHRVRSATRCASAS